VLLHRIHLNPRCKSARRDLADPYQMHATLCRAFFPEENKCPPGALLYRLEPETNDAGFPRVLIQCSMVPDWSRIEPDWLASADPGIDLFRKLAPDVLENDARFRFRLRANPCKVVQGKRQSLVAFDDQRAWMVRKGEQHGFTLAGMTITHQQMIRGRRHDGNVIWAYAALFNGLLRGTNADLFKKAIATGIGRGKVMGLGLLSVVRV
jgi:CRISPR system Cascade subunit CasE